MKDSTKHSNFSILKFLKDADLYVGGFLFALVVILTFVNVVVRYIFKGSIPWSEEVILILFTWATYLGIICCFRYDKHIRIDFFYNLMPKIVRRVLDILIEICDVCLFGYLTYLSCVLCATVGSKSTTVLKISYNILNTVLLVCFGVMAVSAVFKLYHKVKGDYKVENPLADVEAETRNME